MNKMYDIKICRTCETPKPSSEFVPNRRRCKLCQREYQAKWEEKNREQVRNRQRVYRFNNREAVNEAAAKYREKNGELCRARVADWAGKNKDRKRESEQLWRSENKHRLAAKESSRRAHTKKVIPVWASLKEIDRIYERAKILSEESGIKMQVDHIVPLKSKFVCGLHCEANLRVIPATDNLKKGNRTWPNM